MKAKEIEKRAKKICDLLTELGEALQERGIPRTQAGNAVRHNLREGWQVNTGFIYTLQSTERELPEGYAQ